MSKAGKFAKALKLIVTFAAYTLKVTAKLIGRLLKELFKGISKRLRFSITFKTAITYTFIFSNILLILSILLISSFGLFLLFESKSTLQKSTRVTADLISSSTDGIPAAGIKSFADIEGIDITLFDEQKKVIFTTEKNNNVPFNSETSSISGVSFTGDGRMNLNTRITPKDDVNYIQLARPLVKEIQYLLALLAAIAVSFVLAVLLTVLIGSRTLRKMLRPINNMIITARSAKDLHTRLNVVDSHDELKELAETFNEMLDRIETSYELQNQFVSDASHELRTPISVIQGYANLLQRWGKEEKEVLEESVIAIKNEAENMKELVEKLLFLARADKNTQRLEKASFSVNELVDEILKETKLIDSEHNITGEINEIITVNADRGLIKQALRIFIDNSIKYTPTGGMVKINSYLKDKKIKLIIEDNGIGIAKEDLPRIFNRFYKCDKSRAREGGSTGLGLAIAKWIIEKHKGTIEVESALAQGTKIIITLPA